MDVVISLWYQHLPPSSHTSDKGQEPGQ